MQVQIEKLIEDIKANYARPCNFNDPDSDVAKNMIARFNDGIKYTIGKKYIKIIQGGGVWGFIVKEDDGKFRKGDILKAAGWNAPARNHARGNIMDGGYSISWTGPKYMR